jgi:hypothetical protein
LLDLLRAALALPEDEPVAWGNADELDNMLDDRTATVEGRRSGYRGTPLYASPPASNPAADGSGGGELSDEEIDHLVDTHVGEPSQKYPLMQNDWRHFARAVLALAARQGAK